MYSAERTHVLEASIMLGKDLKCGAAASLRRVKDPIALARRVMEEDSIVLLAGGDAESFGQEKGVELVEPAYFDDQLRFEQWLKKREQEDAEEGSRGTLARSRWTAKATLALHRQAAV